MQIGELVLPQRVEMVLTGENGEPDLVARFEMRNGRPECVSFSITTKPNGRAIRTSDLAFFNVDGAATQAFAWHGYSAERATTVGATPGVGEDRRRTAKTLEQVPRRRGPRITRAELERVAEVYRAHIDKAPTRAVAADLGIDERTAARRVQRAREAGLLPPTTPGKRKA